MANREEKIRKQTSDILDAYKALAPFATLSASDFILFRKQAVEELGAFICGNAGSAPDAAGHKPLFEIKPEYETLRSPVPVRRMQKEENKPVSPDNSPDPEQMADGFSLLKKLEDPWN